MLAIFIGYISSSPTTLLPTPSHIVYQFDGRSLRTNSANDPTNDPAVRPHMQALPRNFFFSFYFFKKKTQQCKIASHISNKNEGHLRWFSQRSTNGDKLYTWSASNPNNSQDSLILASYGCCCDDNSKCSPRSGKDTPFTFHAHWIKQRLLVSEDL